MTLNKFSLEIISKQLQIYIRDQDAPGFIQLCHEVRALYARIKGSVKNTFMNDENQMLEHLGFIPPDFLLKILDAYPKNHVVTLQLLGTHASVDQAVITKKIDTGSPLPIAGSQRLIEWGVRQKDLSFIEQVFTRVCQSIRERHADKEDLKCAMVNLYIQALVFRRKDFALISSIVDTQLASIVTSKGPTTYHADVVASLAKMRMAKTLMALVEQGCVAKYAERYNDFKDVRACLPPVMTPRQCNAVLVFLEPTGLAEQILFDETIDLDAHCQAMRETSFQVTQGHDLTVYSIRPFIELMTAENFAVPAKRERILQLLRTVCDAEFERKAITASEVRAKFEYVDVPAFTYKHIRQFKGLELEEAMGL